MLKSAETRVKSGHDCIYIYNLRAYSYLTEHLLCPTIVYELLQRVLNIGNGAYSTGWSNLDLRYNKLTMTTLHMAIDTSLLKASVNLCILTSPLTTNAKHEEQTVQTSPLSQ